MSLQLAIERLGIAICKICASATENHGIAASSIVRPHYPLQDKKLSDLDYSSPPCILANFDVLIADEIGNVLDIVEALAKERGPSEPRSNLSQFNPHLKPVAPPTALSINHLRIIYTLIELLWIIGVQSFLVTVLEDNFDWGDALHPKSLLVSRDTLLSLATSVPNLQQMFSYCQCINKLISNYIFGANMLPRNLNRMLVALLTLANCDDKAIGFSHIKDNTVTGGSQILITVRKGAKQLLTEISFSTENKSLVISELRIASKGPKWLRLAAAELFSQIILSDNGLDAALRAYLEGNFYLAYCITVNSS